MQFTSVTFLILVAVIIVAFTLYTKRTLLMEIITAGFLVACLTFYPFVRQAVELAISGVLWLAAYVVAFLQRKSQAEVFAPFTFPRNWQWLDTALLIVLVLLALPIGSLYGRKTILKPRPLLALPIRLMNLGVIGLALVNQILTQSPNRTAPDIPGVSGLEFKIPQFGGQDVKVGGSQSAGQLDVVSNSLIYVLAGIVLFFGIATVLFVLPTKKVPGGPGGKDTTVTRTGLIVGVSVLLAVLVMALIFRSR